MMGLGIGQQLVQAREVSGRTLEDAERDTRISRRYLQALEDEQFELIPAPVYARGFLRSYSQYLGLDPQALIARFPRDDHLTDAGAERPSAERPIGAVSSRPTWGGPRTSPAGDESHEPTIGVDIGVPVPARRVRSGPSPAARPAAIALVALVALVVIAAVVVLAIVIANLGGDAESDVGSGPIVPATAPAAAGGTDGEGGSSGLEGITPGIVPNVIGQPEDIARLAVQEAGYEVTVVSETSEQYPRGFVSEQAPAAGVAQDVGREVFIVVSEGP